MLYYDRTEVFEYININKTGASKECIVCYYQYCLDKELQFQSLICHDVLMMPIKVNSTAILTIHSAEYCFNYY